MGGSYVTPPVRLLDRPCEAHHATPRCPRMKSAFDVRSAWRFENLSLAVPPQRPPPSRQPSSSPAVPRPRASSAAVIAS